MSWLFGLNPKAPPPMPDGPPSDTNASGGKGRPGDDQSQQSQVTSLFTFKIMDCFWKK